MMKHNLRFNSSYDCPWKRYGLLLLILSCLSCYLQAQDFQVRRFRPLPNDITAYIQPVKDLNEEACALVKVVGHSDFVFSSPLGIVKRQNEIGEIWIYLPKGTRLLTIKHPQWGVLRDYSFEKPLESRMTYELILIPTLTAQKPAPKPMEDHPYAIDTTRHSTTELALHPTPRIRRPKERWCRLFLAAFHAGQGDPTWGAQIALMRKHGAYLGFQSNWASVPATQSHCNKDGWLPEHQVYPYYTGQKKEQSYSVTLGGIHRIFREWCIYEGIGYGQRKVAWETIEHQWLENDGYSCQGITAEIGILYRFRRWTLAGGLHTLQAKCWKGTLGIGYHF